uniref:50S ribosomal protein L20 n=1 Tax=Riquetophycus sp. TaxID=1897556 RepID=A0A1C9C7Y7_9FLOR|nr:ribosomal protein L20 [Riquetophycus sp.]
MTRIKRGNVARKRRKQILRISKGFRASHSKLFRTAKQQVLKSMKYSYVGRKNKKRDYRRIWIIRINAAVKPYQINYSQFINILKKSKIGLNRKMLGQLAILDMDTFDYLVKFSI